MKNLESKLSDQRNALDLHPPGHSERFKSLQELAKTLLDRYNQSSNLQDLEEAVSLQKEAHKLLQSQSPSDPVYRYADCLQELARSLSLCYRKSKDKEDLRQAISFQHEAIGLSHAQFDQNLGDIYFTSYEVSGGIENLKEIISNQDIQDAIPFYETVAKNISLATPYRLNIAVFWAILAHDFRHETVHSAYSTSLHLLRQCLIAQPSLEAHQRFLAIANIPPLASLASDAASAAIDAEKLELAVELLEQGRAMMWSALEAYRSPLEQICHDKEGREVADKFKTLSSRLENLALRPLFEGSTTSSQDVDTNQADHNTLVKEWEGVVETIRKINKGHFSDFLQAPPFSTLQSAAAEGPVILVNTSVYRTDAIILHSNNPPVLVPLSAMGLTLLREEIAKKSLRHRENRETMMILRELWDTIVSPVVDCLYRKLNVPRKSRIWWCPTGDLCGLPLHVAGYYVGRDNTLRDFYVSSYISTLSSLIKARSHTVTTPPTRTPKLLIVGEPSADLKRVESEVDSLRKLFQAGDGAVKVLFGDDAKKKAVLDGLKEDSHWQWIHFACHGRLGADSRPFQTGFQLHDGQILSILDLIAMHREFPNAELAYLSICHSAEGDPHTPDEHIRLSAAFQFCGFRSVVGTLWEMFDDNGPTLSQKFYEYMFRNADRIDFKDSARALHSGLIAMRREKFPPQDWAMFVHIGA